MRGSRKGRSRTRRTSPPWTRARLVEELRRRAGEQGVVKAMESGRLRVHAKRLFGGWEQALKAAGISPAPRGRPPKSGGGAPPPPSERPAAARVIGPAGAPECRRCGARPGDLVNHIRVAHLMSPAHYVARFGPIPQPLLGLEATLRGLRAYLREGGEPTSAALELANPELHAAVLRYFAGFDSAFAIAGEGLSRRNDH